MKRAHYFQHVAFEGLGSIESWLRDRGYTVGATRFFEDTQLPDPDSLDLLIVMGGPMSVNDEKVYPWLVAEKAFIRDAVAVGKPVLGICLGAQLIASALGAAVRPNPCKEIGWFPVNGKAGNDSGTCFTLPATLDVFHWHGETFDLPDGAMRIADSSACRNQGFQIGRSVIGLQFHLETTARSAREIIRHCRDELVPGEFIQDEAAMRAVDEGRYERINDWMSRVLDYLAGYVITDR